MLLCSHVRVRTGCCRQIRSMEKLTVLSRAITEAYTNHTQLYDYYNNKYYGMGVALKYCAWQRILSALTKLEVCV